MAPIVIAIDEGHEMLKYMPGQSFFYDFRRALSHSQGAQIFAILTSTSAHVANILPSWYVERSARARAGARLFPPFNFVFSLGARQLQELPSDDHCAQLISAGRPLFPAYFEADTKFMPPHRFSRLFIFGLLKLSRGSFTYSQRDKLSKKPTGANEGTELKEEHDDSSILHFVLSAVRYDLVISGLAVADLMAASFMATMMFVGSTRDCFAACYPREPLLSEIAAHVCSHEERFCRSLYAASFYRSGHVLYKGDAGEFAAMAALLRAQEHAVMKLRVNQ